MVRTWVVALQTMLRPSRRQPVASCHRGIVTMTQYVKHVRFRKFFPVDREYPIFELVAGDEILLDVSVSDDGVPEVALHEASIGKIFKFDDLHAFLVQGKRLLEEEMAYES